MIPTPENPLLGRTHTHLLSTQKLRCARVTTTLCTYNQIQKTITTTHISMLVRSNTFHPPHKKHQVVFSPPYSPTHTHITAKNVYICDHNSGLHTFKSSQSLSPSLPSPNHQQCLLSPLTLLIERRPPFAVRKNATIQNRKHTRNTSDSIELSAKRKKRTSLPFLLRRLI